MRRWKMLAAIGLVALVPGLAIGCGPADEAGRASSASEAADAGESVNVLRTPITGEMKLILRDIRAAEEQAALAGGYVGWDELRRSYLNRQIREPFEVSLESVTPDGYMATVVHKRTGIRCRVSGGTAAGPRAPLCD